VAETAWATLQRVALDGAHPAWFGLPDEALLARARGSAAGRRLLARSLAAEVAPQLFGTLPISPPASLSGQGWLSWPTAALEELAFDLGTLAFAPAIRERIERNDVLRLRRVLGMRRYADALRPAAGRNEDTPAIRAALDLALADDDVLAAALRRRGWNEWTRFAQARHPVLVERLRLCAAPRDETDADESANGVRWLSDAAIATHLAGAQAVPSTAEVADGARGDH
jgi:hypothetical protein